jgi:ankyrin repeat protein
MAKNRKQTDIHAQYRKDMERGVGGHEIDNHLPDLDTLLPPYLIPGSPEVANYLARNPESKAGKLARHKKKEEGTTIAHTYAAAGEVTKLAQILEEKQELITAADTNGWTPLHEGTRAGSVEVVRLLLAKGANINHRTGKNEKGYSVLALAHEIHGPDHPISKFIASVGGELIEPEL